MSGRRPAARQSSPPVPTADILVNNNAGPPAKNFRDLDHAALVAGVEANMIAPIALIQALIDGMIERRFGRIVNITSGSVKGPLPGLDLSSGARAGLTGFVAGVAREVAGANVTINQILPGAFDTDRQTAIAQGAAARTGKTVEEVLGCPRGGYPRRSGTASPPSSVISARSSPAPMPATSPARTS